MRWLIVGLLVCLIFLQVRLWVGDGSVAEVVQLQREIEKQEQENNRLNQRNQDLAKQVEELKTGLKAIEARARRDMGMVKEGETFYMVVEEDDEASSTQ